MVKKCFFSLHIVEFEQLSLPLSVLDAEAKSRRVASRPCAIPEARKREVFEHLQSA